MPKKNSTLEEKMLKIEEIAQMIENGEVPIDKLVELHKQSTVLIQECRKEVEEIENTIIESENAS